jgi:hypothetical protein
MYSIAAANSRRDTFQLGTARRSLLVAPVGASSAVQEYMEASQGKMETTMETGQEQMRTGTKVGQE